MTKTYENEKKFLVVKKNIQYFLHNKNKNSKEQQKKIKFNEKN